MTTGDAGRSRPVGGCGLPRRPTRPSGDLGGSSRPSRSRTEPRRRGRGRGARAPGVLATRQAGGGDRSASSAACIAGSVGCKDQPWPRASGRVRRSSGRPAPRGPEGSPPTAAAWAGAGGPRGPALRAPRASSTTRPSSALSDGSTSLALPASDLDQSPQGVRVLPLLLDGELCLCGQLVELAGLLRGVDEDFERGDQARPVADLREPAEGFGRGLGRGERGEQPDGRPRRRSAWSRLGAFRSDRGPEA